MYDEQTTPADAIHLSNGDDAFKETGPPLKLVSPSDNKIRRHVKKKADANPYDPAWSLYFAGWRTVVAGPVKRSLKGLSRIRDNSYVRF